MSEFISIALLHGDGVDSAKESLMTFHVRIYLCSYDKKIKKQWP